MSFQGIRPRREGIDAFCGRDPSLRSSPISRKNAARFSSPSSIWVHFNWASGGPRRGGAALPCVSEIDPPPGRVSPDMVRRVGWMWKIINID